MVDYYANETMIRLDKNGSIIIERSDGEPPINVTDMMRRIEKLEAAVLELALLGKTDYEANKV